ncbi:MAG TPA: hypothetical protein VNW46_06945, partial [Gemmatimonadaceae bacterium]|nr:hypothetical protein [Gemmatimonadaceae bacterium]
PAVSSSATGAYSVGNVPVGTGTIAVSSLPSTCTAPSPQSYTGVTNGATLTVNITVTCTQSGASLTVRITAPAGVTPAVTVSGPSSYHQTLTATQTLTGLTPGTYTITATNVVVSDPVVPVTDSGVITGSPATLVAGGQDTAKVAYAPRVAGSGALWVANGNNNVANGFTGAQLHASGTPAPTDTLTTPSGDPLGVAIDVAGNLWMTNYVANTVVEYTPAQLAAGGTPTATVTLSGSALSRPHGLAFDAQGNLWVASRNANTVVEYTTSQLTATGSPTPTVTLTAAATSAGPTALAFDAQGNLWVGNYYQNTVVEYATTQLGASATPTPTVTLSATANSLAGPFVLAFDASGTLWVGNANGVATTIVGYSTSQLATSGSPVPASTINLPSGLAHPVVVFGLAFDASGQLWLSDPLNNALYAYTSTQLAAGGSPTPQTTISSSALNGPGGLAFNPHASTLPLH